MLTRSVLKCCAIRSLCSGLYCSALGRGFDVSADNGDYGKYNDVVVLQRINLLRWTLRGCFQ